MLPALYDDQRRSLRRLSVMLCGASIAIAPFLSSSTFDASAADVVTPKAWSAIAVPPTLSYQSVRVDRDPFVSDIIRSVAPADSTSGSLDSNDIVLPPNAGADGAVVDQQVGSIVVRAVVLGKQSRALVDIGGSVRVLGIGDVVAGSTIMSIDATGIALANGQRIPLTEAPR